LNESQKNDTTAAAHNRRNASFTEKPPNENTNEKNLLRELELKKSGAEHKDTYVVKDRHFTFKLQQSASGLTNNPLDRLWPLIVAQR
jgi:hypothetical protein